MTIQASNLLNFMYSKHLVSPIFVERELQSIGKSIIAPDLRIADMIPLDHDHFGGVGATEKCITSCNINSESTIFDIGSGLGGPARYIGWRVGCNVTGVEIQDARYNFAVQVTKTLHLESRVSFINADICEVNLPLNYYSHVISFLTILHIAQKQLFLKSIGQYLMAKGVVFIEDYCRGIGYSTKNENDLLSIISCPELLSVNDYLESLTAGGIQIDKTYDMTSEWTDQARERCADFETHRLDKIRIHGDVTINKASQFAKGVAALFETGIIQGIRIIATKK